MPATIITTPTSEFADTVARLAGELLTDVTYETEQLVASDNTFNTFDIMVETGVRFYFSHNAWVVDVSGRPNEPLVVELFQSPNANLHSQRAELTTVNEEIAATLVASFVRYAAGLA